MAEVMNVPQDSVDQSPKPSADDEPPPPPPQTSRRRERDSRELDRPPNRRDYHDRNTSPPLPPRERGRDYKRRRSPSSPPYKRRYSSPRRLSPNFKRSRRGSPRGGYGPDDSQGVIMGGNMSDETNMPMHHAVFPTTGIQYDQYKPFDPAFDDIPPDNIADFRFSSPFNLAPADYTWDSMPKQDISSWYL